jgi:hypothetical protein
MSRQKQKRELETIAAEYGFIFAGKTARGHLRWHGPGGSLVVTGSSLGEACGLPNAIALFRRQAARIHDQEARP